MEKIFFGTFLIAAAAGLLGVPLADAQVVQRAVLYDQYNGEGNYVVIPEDYVADLGTIGWDNRVRSVCVTGIWLFYQNVDFNYGPASGMEYVFGRNNYCVNIRTIAGTISSVRYAGAPKDYRSDSLTLYENDYFQGEEEYTPTDLANLNLAGNHKSIIITGNSDWTVYDLPGYQGNRLCLRVPEPGSGTPAFLADVQNLDPAIPHGTIRSVSKGCVNAKESYTLESFARGVNANRKNQFVPEVAV